MAGFRIPRPGGLPEDSGGLSLKVRLQKFILAKFGLPAFVIALLVGAVLLGAGWIRYTNAKINPAWTRMQGNIVSVRAAGAKGSRIYTPVVSYQVSNQNYTIDAQSVSGSYPAPGTHRQVAYDPADPAQAVVVDGAGVLSNVLLLVVGVAVIIAAVVLFTLHVRRARDASADDTPADTDDDASADSQATAEDLEQT